MDLKWIILHLDSTDGFVKKESKNCDLGALSDTYNNIDDAKDACRSDPKCFAINDLYCDDKYYRLCTQSPVVVYSSIDCIYTKQGIMWILHAIFSLQLY